MDEYVDLHMHSTCSDGTFTPEVVVRRAAELGLVAIGLTDHDSVEGVSTAEAVGREVGVDVVPGTELSAQVDEKDIHILAYFIDPEDPELANCLTQFREDRLRRAEKMVRKLNQMGIQVRMEQVLAKAEGAAIGRPHVADVMVEEGFVFSANEAFYKYIGYAKPAYQPKFSISPADAIEVIHTAGGLACLAHPLLYRRDSIIPDLVDQGLDGIEVMHIKHGPEEVQRYTDIADRYGLLKTGGSDCHGDGRGESVMGRVAVPRAFVDTLQAAHQEKARSKG